jgi:hypothetical protein
MKPNYYLLDLVFPGEPNRIWLSYEVWERHNLGNCCAVSTGAKNGSNFKISNRRKPLIHFFGLGFSTDYKILNLLFWREDSRDKMPAS